MKDEKSWKYITKKTRKKKKEKSPLKKIELEKPFEA